MDQKEAEALALRVSSLAEAMVSGVLRALAAREEFTLPPGSTLGGCMPITDGGINGTMRISITLGAAVKFGAAH